jgi:hypothetical protein
MFTGVPPTFYIEVHAELDLTVQHSVSLKFEDAGPLSRAEDDFVHERVTRANVDRGTSDLVPAAFATVSNG